MELGFSYCVVIFIYVLVSPLVGKDTLQKLQLIKSLIKAKNRVVSKKELALKNVPNVVGTPKFNSRFLIVFMDVSTFRNK
ncbi:MAG: hypothetical protein EAZ47_08930 [Bacteroidetes bacterium]|nr:MAG: hypothetical protein EAY72_12890 [Bacteroidota bacterium]TAF92329.1 MAG: hypothetical protein EAZ47_08930 [Bacteroidota bacterium]